MLLSELEPVLPITVARDGQFRSLGFVDHDADELLVAVYEGRYLDRLQKPNISCVITSERLVDRIPSRLGLVIDTDPKTRFYTIHDYLCRHTDFYGPSMVSRIAESARVHPASYVAPANVEIGPGTMTEPNATILERTRIGADVIIRAGTVVGAEGFGAVRLSDRQVHVRHGGSVELADQVQILSNCTIVRATFGGATTIGRETIVNAQSYVAHNVRIGKRCRIAAGVIIAGSAQIGDDVWIGPNAVISNSVRIGDGASVTLGAVVIRDVAPGERVSGHFAISHRRFLEFLARSRYDDGG